MEPISRLTSKELDGLSREQVEAMFRNEAERQALLTIALEYTLYNQSQLTYKLNKLRREAGEIK
jgi:hypothetical protein